MFKLVIQDDEGKTTVVPLIRDEITIGRKEGNTIRLTERNVSRRHARILRSNNEVQIEDLGSYNGIRVNNARIAERVSLRISDQVQIGDYKLYLKAEGVEQVDDARTMPIERIENVGATEVMPAVAPNGTAPTPAIPASAGRVLGAADTDPAARPVATPAQVAALTAVTGYGKLVVLSSNFAGKEFDLTRPQMIIGRTDENDLVINHRSISRNHAKVTRDTETQRYTISDLQSSNGVRVNGQDYGKVELRRADVVDLGHVRLRFVEPGEDFVFARDAQIADVEGTGSKRGAMVAIVLAVVVLGAVAAYFALKGSGTANAPNGIVTGSNGSDLVALGTGSDGSGGSAAVMIADTIDAAAPIPTTNDDAKRIAAECQQAVVERNWSSVNVCADKLTQFDATAAQDFHARARAEVKNDATKAKIDQAIADQNLVKANKLLGDIPEASVYKKDTEAEVDALETKLLDDFKTRAAANKAANKCKDNDILIAQATEKTPKAAELLKPYKCTVAVQVEDCFSILRNETRACRTQFCSRNPDSAKCASATTAPACNFDELSNAGLAAVSRGEHSTALAQFDAALRCKYDVHTLQLAFMEACRASKLEPARRYWKKMSTEMRNRQLVQCLQSHITQEQLDQ